MCVDGWEKEKPCYTEVHKPSSELVNETESWVQKKAKESVVPEEVTAQAKEKTKTFRPNVRA